MKELYFGLCLLFSIPFLHAQSEIFHFRPDQVDTLTTHFYGKNLLPQKEIAFSADSLRLNFNPAIAFNGTDDRIEMDIELADPAQLTVFTVMLVENDSLEEGQVWGIFGEEASVGLTTKKAFNPAMESYYDGAISGEVVLHTFTQSHRARQSAPNPRSYLSLGVSQKDSNAIYFKGRIGEVIAFKRRLRGKQRQKLETYLALKYGIGLGGDYLSSTNKKIWDTKETEGYTNRVTGIGRDDGFRLHQTRSTNSSEPGVLTIGLDPIPESVLDDTKVLEDGNFLLWGDNGADLRLEKSHGIDRIPVLQRKWMIRSTGQQFESLGTALAILPDRIFGTTNNDDNYLLVIDRSGTGEFRRQDVEYIEAAPGQSTDRLVFKALEWDPDGSGSDVFSFAVKKSLTATLTGEVPLICPESTTELEYGAGGGFPPYRYTLSNDKGFSRDWESGDSIGDDRIIHDAASGHYTLKVTDSEGHTATAAYEVAEDEKITVELGPGKQLGFEETLDLEPRLSDPQKIVSYQWEGPDELRANSPSLTIDRPGIYTLTVTTALGCTYTDTVAVNESFVRSFVLHPNPSKGDFNVEVELRARADIEVSLFTIAGTLLQRFTVKDKHKTTVKGKSLRQPGVYLVVLKAEGEIVSKKLIVE